MKLSHTVCGECGVYDGRVVVVPKIKTQVKKLTPKNEEKTTLAADEHNHDHDHDHEPTKTDK